MRVLYVFLDEMGSPGHYVSKLVHVISLSHEKLLSNRKIEDELFVAWLSVALFCIRMRKGSYYLTQD